MSRAIPLSEVVDILRRVVDPAAWETPDEIRRDALDRLTHEDGGGVVQKAFCSGCDSAVLCPECGSVGARTVRP